MSARRHHRVRPTPTQPSSAVPRRGRESDIRTCDECARPPSALEASLCHECRRAKGWENDEEALA